MVDGQAYGFENWDLMLVDLRAMIFWLWDFMIELIEKSTDFRFKVWVVDLENEIWLVLEAWDMFLSFHWAGINRFGFQMVATENGIHRGFKNFKIDFHVLMIVREFDSWWFWPWICFPIWDSKL